MSQAEPAARELATAAGDAVSASGATKSKQTVFGGRKVNLHTAAASYRVLAGGIGLGIAALFVPLLLGVWLSGAALFWLLFCPLQIAAAVTMGIGIANANRAMNESEIDCTDRGIVLGVLGIVPVLGMLPAASMTGKLHQILSSVGVPLGIFGPSRLTTSVLRHGICPVCDYDLTQLIADRCPECNAHVDTEKPTSDAMLTSVEIVSADARSLARKCRQTAWTGIGLGLVQLSLCVGLAGDVPNPGLLVFVFPGLVFGAIASTVSFVGKQVLREQWTVDFAAVGILSIFLPPVAAVLLFRQAIRLSVAAARGHVG